MKYLLSIDFGEVASKPTLIDTNGAGIIADVSYASTRYTLKIQKAAD